jgi:hypothetical protein
VSLVVSTCFWRANRHSAPASRCYTEEWVNKLARGFRRHLTVPHRFVAFVDRTYEFAEGIEQRLLKSAEPDWSSMIEPFALAEPSIIVGLDTIVCGSIDHFAAHCLTADRIALPRSPGKPYACNAIVLKPQGHTDIFTRWRGENDMEWLRDQPHDFIDDRWPGQVVSYKCDVRPNGLGDARVVYFHGRPKMGDVLGEPWVRLHWR